MIGLGAVVGGAAWKVAAIALLVLMVIGGAGGGTAYWMAAGARDQALTDLKAEQGVSAELRAGINTQNTAITNLGREKLAAEARGLASKQLADAAGWRYDSALQRLDGARGTTCDEAMPFVNKLLEDVR